MKNKRRNNPHSEYQLRNLIVIIAMVLGVLALCWLMQSPFDPLH